MDNYQESPRILSLCTGYGGLERGIEAVIGKCTGLAYVEIEAFAIANLVNKMETGKLDPVPIWTDLKTFDARRFRGAVDILTGGYPCQPFSAAGKQGQNEPDGKRGQTLTGAANGQMWPTVSARDWKDTPGMAQDATDKSGKFRNRIDQLPRAVYHYGQADPENPNTNGNNQESWPTPRTPTGGKESSQSKKNRDSGGIDLQTSAGNWSTPEAKNDKGYHNQRDGSRIEKLGTQAGKGKLNPNWVEQLMGLETGWTALDYSEME